jgi:predicted MFS family arabinose efflux permease
VGGAERATAVLRRIAGAYRAAFSGLPRQVWILALASLVNRSGTMVLPFLGLYLTTRLGFSVQAAGHVLSLYGLGALLGAWLGGSLADRVGPVAVQVASLLATGAGFLVLGQVHGRAAIGAAVLGLSVVAECFRPAMFTAVAERSAPAVRTRSLALVRLAVNLGMSVGPAVGGVLAVRHYGLLFVVDAVTCWMAAALIWATVARRAEVPQRRPVGTGKASASPWRDRPFLAFLLIMLLMGTVFFQIMSTLPLYFREVYRFPEDTIGILLGLNALVIVAVEMILVRALERYDHLIVVGLGCLALGAGFGLMPLGSGKLFAAATVLVWTVGEMLSVPMANSVATTRAPAGGGRYLGAYFLAFSGAFVLAPTIGTTVYERLGPSALWFGVAGLGVVLCLGCLALSRSFRVPGNPGAGHAAGGAPDVQE